MSMSLYEIDQAILDLVDPETGELMDYDAFASLQMEREQKIEGMALWYKDLTANAKAIKEEVDALNERRRAMENRADRLKSYLDKALDGQKFQTARCAVSFRKTSSVHVDDHEALIRWLEQNGYDGECIRYKDPEISKAGVGQLIKSGVPVPFASIQTGRSVGVK